MREKRCRVCPEVLLKSEDEYLLHIRDFHKGKFVDCYMCSVCGKTFKTRSELTRHNNSNCGTRKQFSCKVCGQKLMTPGSLYNHMRRHNNRASFMCRFCAKLFLTAGQLNVHEKIHTQQKDFVCDVCGKGFCHRQSLITHSSMHTGIKPYLCEGCGKSFSCVGNLLKHRKTHADSCGLLSLTTHRVQNPSTRIKVKINTPASSKLKMCKKNQEMKQKLAMLESKLRKKDQPENIPKDELTEKANDIYHASAEMQVSTLNNMEQQANICKKLKVDICSKNETIYYEEQEDTAINNLSNNCSLNKNALTYLVENANRNVKNGKLDTKDNTISVNNIVARKKLIKRKKDPIFDVQVNNFIKERKLENASMASCKYCNKEYTQFRWLYKHEQDHERNDPGDKTDLNSFLFKCSYCKKSFGTKGELKQHRQLAHLDILTCHDCGDRSFSSTDSLRLHKHVFHNGVPRKVYTYICEKCGKNFKQKSHFQNHSETNCGPGPRFQCKICEKNFASNHSLKAHLRIHTSKKDIECKFCGKHFYWKGQLKIHERSHTGEKPYKCLFCPSAFAYRDSLITHSTLHTGIKPYFCKGCGWRFSCIGNLVKHKTTHANTCGAWYQVNGKEIL